MIKTKCDIHKIHCVIVHCLEINYCQKKKFIKLVFIFYVLTTTPPPPPPKKKTQAKCAKVSSFLAMETLLLTEANIFKFIFWRNTYLKIILNNPLRQQFQIFAKISLLLRTILFKVLVIKSC